LQAGDIAAAERMAHSIRGVAGNIGASQLTTAATELEQALAKGEINTHSLALFSRSVAATLAAIREALPEAVQAALPVAAEAPMAAPNPDLLVKRLATYLANGDGEVLDFFSAKQAELCLLFAEDLRPMEAAINDFDFQKAHALLGAAMAKRHISLE